MARYKLDTGNSGSDEILVGDSVAEVTQDVLSRYEVDELPKGWTIEIIDEETTTATSTRDTLTHWATVIKCDIEYGMGLLAEELCSASPRRNAESIARRIDVIQADFLFSIRGLKAEIKGVADLANHKTESHPAR